MTSEEFKKYLVEKKRIEIEGVESKYRIKELEKRIESLKKSLLSASGWSTKEIIRTTLKQNEDLLEAMKRQFRVDQL